MKTPLEIDAALSKQRTALQELGTRIGQLERELAQSRLQHAALTGAVQALEFVAQPTEIQPPAVVEE